MSSIEHFRQAPQHVAEKAHGADLHNFISELWRPAAQWVEKTGAKIAPRGMTEKK